MDRRDKQVPVDVHHHIVRSRLVDEQQVRIGRQARTSTRLSPCKQEANFQSVICPHR